MKNVYISKIVAKAHMELGIHLELTHAESRTKNQIPQSHCHLSYMQMEHQAFVHTFWLVLVHA